MAALASYSLNRNVAVCCKIVLLLLFQLYTSYTCTVKTRLWIMDFPPSIFIIFFTIIIILTFLLLLVMLSAN